MHTGLQLAAAMRVAEFPNSLSPYELSDLEVEFGLPPYLLEEALIRRRAGASDEELLYALRQQDPDSGMVASAPLDLDATRARAFLDALDRVIRASGTQ